MGRSHWITITTAEGTLYLYLNIIRPSLFNLKKTNSISNKINGLNFVEYPCCNVNLLYADKIRMLKKELVPVITK